MRIRFYNRGSGTNSLIDATEVVLSDLPQSYGIKRLDNNEVVVPANTLMTRIGVGSYEYNFNTATPYRDYRYSIRWTYNGQIKYLENVIIATSSEVGYTVYASIVDADEYFQTRLHSDVWDEASNEDKVKALITGTRILDTLRYRYHKTSYDQALEFPRNGSFEIPLAFKQANAEIALALLDGVDPESEYRNLRVSSRRYSSVGTSYDTQNTPHYILAGIPSLTAWNLIQPFMADGGNVKLHRVS